MTFVLAPFPADLPEKGRYHVWDKQWKPAGYADMPQHQGQVAIRFPLDATPFECFMGAYVRAAVGVQQ